MVSLRLNKSDYRLLWVFFVFMSVWLALKFYTEDHSFSQVLFDMPIIIAKTVVAFFVVRWLIQKYLAERRQYFLGITLCVLVLVTTGFLDMLRDYFGTGHTWSDLPSWGYIFIHSFYYSAADVSAPFVLLIGKKYFDNQILLSKTREKQKDIELKLLRAQLSPHFLFNNLNTVDALIDTNPGKAKEYISRLSSLYRYLITTKDKELVFLNQELTMARDYFYLIKTRFGDAYTFEIDSDLDLTTLYIPSGSLQTVLENVVKHNHVSKGNSIKTTLVIANNTLVVTNNKGATKDKRPSLGTGLKSLKERYELLLGKEIIVIDTVEKFIVKLPLTQVISSI